MRIDRTEVFILEEKEMKEVLISYFRKKTKISGFIFKSNFLNPLKETTPYFIRSGLIRKKIINKRKFKNFK